ncbi:WD40 repeat domain-containing protein [Streptomyces sp. NPDC056638]|uniref:WD40 repeat domain-containing protein n=1 Tax=Streptomyces sp. NPDC056638 TaxID=3345887 RepID=UPI0036CA1734
MEIDDRPHIVTGGDDGTVRVWDLTTREQVADVLTGHTGRVRSVATAVVDGRPVAIIGSGTVGFTDLDADNAGIDVDTVGSVWLWDLASMQQIRPTVAIPLGAKVVDMTSDGRLAVAFGHERTVCEVLPDI